MPDILGAGDVSTQVKVWLDTVQHPKAETIRARLRVEYGYTGEQVLDVTTLFARFIHGAPVVAD